VKKVGAQKTKRIEIERCIEKREMDKILAIHLIHRRCYFYFYPCCASSAIASLAALAVFAAVSAAARSHSSATATLASCRCCALEATER
jgi:hypothetical protein